MRRYVMLRLLGAIPSVLLVLTVVFFAMRFLPGDPATAVLGDRAPPEQIARFRHRLGLDQPLLVQYGRFVVDTARGDFGRSIANDTPIGDLLAQNLPYTLELTAAATVIGVLVGVPLGVLPAIRRGGVTDYSARLFALAGYCIPDFFLGALLLTLLGLKLDVFPVMGAGKGLLDGLYHLILPAITIGVIMAAFVSRLTRSAMLDVLRLDFVRTARAKGLREMLVIFKHALRNAMMPVVTGLGIYILTALSGSIAIELVFSRPGIGELMINAVESRDYPVVQATLAVFAMFVVVVNLLIDIAAAVIDPRARTP
jgi:peptide/nickel transport system permease protein